MLNTPILFVIFNRPETTKQVFESIRNAQPKQLFIAADGPRADKLGEDKKVEEVRKIVTAIDWDCEVHKLFREENLGCGVAVSSAINWFFENVEEGIILEDDCLPSPSFFYYCETLLQFYRANETIMHISGSGFFDLKNGDSYYFSNYNYIWGWATWRRAWKHYNFGLDGLEQFINSKALTRILYTEQEVSYFLNAFQEVKVKKHTWDYQWTYALWANNGISINPGKNLVLNIGFGPDATHTKVSNDKYSKKELGEMIEIIHPTNSVVNKKRDYQVFKEEYHSPTTLINHIRNLSYKFLHPKVVLVLSKLLNNLFK